MGRGKVAVSFLNNCLINTIMYYILKTEIDRMTVIRLSDSKIFKDIQIKQHFDPKKSCLPRVEQPHFDTDNQIVEK